MNRPSGRQLLAALAALVVLVAVASGLFVIGSPDEERTRRLDQRRAEDLRQISAFVDLYWRRHGRLPSSLDELARESGVTISIRDPIGGMTYEYRTLDEKKVELCATFDRESEGRPFGGQADFWSHAGGRQCFQPEVREVGR